MKIVIAKSTVAAINTTSRDIVAQLLGEQEAAGVHAHLLAGELPCFEGKVHRMHYSSVFECFEYEIDDSMLLRICALYLKVARIVAPAMKAVYGVVALLKGEVTTEIEAINAEFEDVREPEAELTEVN